MLKREHIPDSSPTGTLCCARCGIEAERVGDTWAWLDDECPCTCTPLANTGGGHRGDCPCFDPECTCYEVTGGHMPGCPFGAALAKRKERARC